MLLYFYANVLLLGALQADTYFTWHRNRQAMILANNVYFSYPHFSTFMCSKEPSRMICLRNKILFKLGVHI